MKNVLIMVGTGVGLFTATVVGVLGVQGRLNHGGTRGIPLLSSLFPEQDRGEDSESGGSTPGDQAVAQPPHPATENGAEAGGAMAAPAGTNPDGPAAPSTERLLRLAPGQYRPGALFSFPTLDGGVSVEELNDYLRQARQTLEQLERRKAALDAYEADLDARQSDIEAREDTISAKMIEVEQERQKLERRISEFKSEVELVRQDDLKPLREYARTLASFGPEKASAYLLEEWKTEDGRSRIVKVLAVMDPEEADAILARIDNAKVRELLLARLKVALEQAKK